MEKKEGSKRKKSRAKAEPKVEVLAPADTKLIDDAVRVINQKASEAAKRFSHTLIDIGQYVLEKFYDNDPEKASARGRKPASIRELTRRRDLDISKSHLHTAVSLACQYRLLLDSGKVEPKLLAETSATHQAVLLPVKDVKKKVELLQVAVKENLPVRALQERVEGLDKGDGKRVRRGPGFRIPSPVRKLKELDLGTLMSEERLGRLDARKLSAYQSELEAAAAVINSMLVAVKKAARATA